MSFNDLKYCIQKGKRMLACTSCHNSVVYCESIYGPTVEWIATQPTILDMQCFSGAANISISSVKVDGNGKPQSGWQIVHQN